MRSGRTGFLTGFRKVVVGLAVFTAVMLGLAWVGMRLFGDDGVIAPVVVLIVLVIGFCGMLIFDSGEPADPKLAASVLACGKPNSPRQSSWWKPAIGFISTAQARAGCHGASGSW